MDRIELTPREYTIHVKLVWSVGLEQELIINRVTPAKKINWTNAEDKIIREYYPHSTKEEILELLPGRSWAACRRRAITLKIKRETKSPIVPGPRFTVNEDELVRQFYAGKITSEEVIEKTGRNLVAIYHRADYMGLPKRGVKCGWHWVDTHCNENAPRAGV